MFYLTHDELCCVDIFRLQELNAFLKPEEKDIILFMWEQINVLKPILICFIYFWSEVIIPPPKKTDPANFFIILSDTVTLNENMKIAHAKTR